MVIFITVLALALLIKLTGFLLGLCGRMLGAVLSLIGFLFLGVVLVIGFSITFLAIPGLLLLGGAIIAGKLIQA